MIDLNYNLSEIRSFVEKLGREVLTLRKKPLRVEVKHDGSRVTDGDYLSHHRLTEFLSQNYPYPIISEEQENPFPPTFPINTVWLLDPIDGTSYYLRGKEDFSLMVALVHNRKPVMSLIYQPTHRVGYYAELGKGSYRFTEGGDKEPIRVDHHTPVTDRSFQVGGVKSYGSEYAWFTQRGIHKYNLKGGIGLKAAAISEGEAHYYLNLNRPLKVWDVMPSVLLAEEAGGWVGDAQGGELTYDELGYTLVNGLCIAPDQELLPWLKESARETQSINS